MSRLTVVRQAIATQIATLPEVGVVHARFPYTANATDYASAFRAIIAGAPRVAAWLVAPERLDIDPGSVTFDGTGVARQTYLIYGYRGIETAADTDTTLVDLAERVLLRLWEWDARAIPGVVHAGPAAMRAYDPVVQLGDVVCHRVTLVLPVDVMIGDA